MSTDLPLFSAAVGDTPVAMNLAVGDLLNIRLVCFYCYPVVVVVVAPII